MERMSKTIRPFEIREGTATPKVKAASMDGPLAVRSYRNLAFEQWTAKTQPGYIA